MALDPAAIRLDGQVAVVTGAGSGIGRGIAAGLKAFGADIAVWERDPDSSASAAAEVGGLSVPTDVRDGDEVDRALAARLDRYGQIDVLEPGAEHGGIRVSRTIDKLGYKGLETVEMTYVDHRVPASAVLGGAEGLGRGLHFVLGSLELGRIVIARGLMARWAESSR